MVVGRAAERERLAALFDAAARDASGTLLISGPAGIGKTALVAAAVADARDRGATVLHARAVEAESDLPFAGLHELVGPVLDRRRSLPAAQATALEVALGLAAGPAPAPFAVAVALLALLEVVADESPLVLVAVDDVQWLDAGSLEALLFVVRRIPAEGVAIVLGARPEPDRGLHGHDLERLELAGLTADEAHRLVRAVAPDGAAAATVEQVVDVSAGHPLALVELTRGLTAEQLAGIARLPSPVRPGEAVERAFAADVATLPAAAREALVVLAAEERLTRRALDRVLARLGLPERALDEPLRRGIVEADGPHLRFRHPVLRAVVYHGAGGAQRAAAHRALAEQASPVRRAWHRAAAASGPDEQVAAALEDAAHAIDRDRGATVSAARALERAGALSPDPEQRTRRLAAAAGLLVSAGAIADAEAAIDAVSPDASPAPEVRADLQLVRGTVAMRTGRLDDGARLLTEEAELVAAADPARAAEMLLAASLRHRVVGDYPAMDAVAVRAAALTASGDPTLHALAGLVRGLGLVNTGRPAEADAAFERHVAALERGDAVRPGAELFTAPAHGSIFTGRLDRAERLLDRQIDDARRRSALTALIYPLAVRGLLELRRGRLGAAYGAGSEALTLAVDTRQHSLVMLCAGLLAMTEAALGRAADCREHTDLALALCDTVGAASMALWSHVALGTLELGLGRPEQALVPLEHCRRSTTAIGLTEPNVIRWQGDYVEALIRLGRTADAERALEDLAPTIDVGPSSWAGAIAARYRGVLLGGTEGERLLDEAIARFEAADEAFEAARSRLLLGELLRRGRQRGRARGPLQAALTAFERAGAVPWASRARDELRATGGPTGAGSRTRATVAAARDDLTPHEMRVALLVADGRTNPEVAAELFIARKTVEHHLSQIYRKLDLRSRTELARELAGERAD